MTSFLDQLALDCGRDADCTLLHLTGSLESLFKVRLSYHGYTLAAKVMEGQHSAFLRQENDVYHRPQDIQGKHVRVCLGTIDLVKPYCCDGMVSLTMVSLCLYLGRRGSS